MSATQDNDGTPDGVQARRAEAVRLIVTRRERAPRSPRMERALKRLIWRYLSPAASDAERGEKLPLDEREGQGVSEDAER